MLTEIPFKETPLKKYWQNLSFWLWLVAGIVAVVIFISLLVIKPRLATTYTPEQFDTIVVDEQERGFYATETTNGEKWVWTQPDFYILFDFNTKKPVEITVEIRSAALAGGPDAPVQVFANGVAVGQLRPDPANPRFQALSLKFTAPSLDVQQLKLAFTATAFKPPTDRRTLGTMIKSVTVNKSEAWSSIEKRYWLLWILPGLAMLGLGGWYVSQRNKIALGGYVAVATATGGFVAMAFAVMLLAQIGIIDPDVFWLWLLGCAYLGLFAGVTALALPVNKNRSLYSLLKNKTAVSRRKHPLLWALFGLALANLVITFVLYFRAYIETGNIFWFSRFWDSPEYVFIAHGLYDPNDALLKIADFARHSRVYWTAHFPAYPLLIMAIAPVVSFTYAPLILNFIFGSLFAWVFYCFVREFNYTPNPFWLSLVALILPLRWLIYHTVGASEPMFTLFILVSLYFFKKENYLLAGLAGAVVAFTRPNGIMLGIGYGLLILWWAGMKLWQDRQFSIPLLLKAINWRATLAVFLVPVGLLAAFLIFWWRYGDFLAYFHIEEEVKHFIPFPFPSFGQFSDANPGIFYNYLLEVAGLVILWRKKFYDLFWIGLSLVGLTFFLKHPDVIRYSLPAFPLVLAIPFAEYLNSKVARWLAIPVIVAVYFYTWSVIGNPGKLAYPETWDVMRQIVP